ncbi:TA system toxin CbtA family protein [Enterobacter mori]
MKILPATIRRVTMPYPLPGVVWLMLLISLLLQSCGLTLSGTLFNDENVILKNEAGTYPNTEGNYDEK